MKKNPTRVKIDDKYFEINYDFKNIIEVIQIIGDASINDYERAIAVIYKMFGDEGINNRKYWDKFLDLARKFLSLNQEINNDKESDIDFVQDYSYIKASFLSEYGIDIDKTDLHWWDFITLINGLSNSELGNCCILNRIRNIRNMNLNDIKDVKMREQYSKAKQQFALNKTETREHTKEEEISIQNFLKNFE